uniref:Uncharacterized protein n=1 Tax=Parascaris univalens TaxID=6257 RepID=A0A915AIS1_PARUN
MLDEYKAYKPFMGCVYEVDGDGSYDTRDCIKDDDERAYMKKVYNVKKGKNCITRVDHVPCSLRQSKIYNFNVEHLEQFPQCAGIRRVNISTVVTARTYIFVSCFSSFS